MGRRGNDQRHPARAVPRRSRLWNLIAVAIAMSTGLALALLPLGTSLTVDSNGLATTNHYSLLSSEGAGVLFVVAIPALLVSVPLVLGSEVAAYRSRVVITALLGIFVFLGALSIGVFFMPTMIAMAVAVWAHSTERSATPAPNRV